MSATTLRLNDFKSFEDFLFTEKERQKPEQEKWKKYIGVTNITSRTVFYFIPPIPYNELKLIEEYQLCHYAYWTCIAIFNPMEKIDIRSTYGIPLVNCYACEYSYKHKGQHSICFRCPLKRTIKNCIRPYSKWRSSGYQVDRSHYALEIAVHPWKEK